MTARARFAHWLSRNWPQPDRRKDFRELRKALEGADDILVQRIRSLDPLEQGSLDRLSGASLRSLAAAQRKGVERELDSVWADLRAEMDKNDK